ncbi:hypothetical protein [Beijerinckia indica]|uniref:Uncharacterized protein n=1 Tax=Beijerinckia indica subsp. indica (strain ATCC 9039 / DSM 1715 / NCIMB 8712) TaxID=395963 RepID=B2IFD6_BEII9|nr:hypothetical protein [Beijerinckia indica]ACB97036.1 hypothetical protein Bind_3479 [Beijerinckia indica subsp. indica ATCC 9039]
MHSYWAVLLILVLIGLPLPLAAQTADRSAQDDAQAARIDALLATPGSRNSPLENLIATAPELERPLRTPRFTFNSLSPFAFNSNAELARHGGTSTLELSPTQNLSWATPVFDLPLRLSLNARMETDRFASSRGADLDKAVGTVRLQYINPNDDQGFAPYFVYAPRADFLPTFEDRLAIRHDLNVGFNQRFNFDEHMQRITPTRNTSASAVWSLGLTMFGQRRFRTPAPASSAFFIIPSASYVISEEWNASLAVQMLGRWFDADAMGFSRRDFEVEPIGTLEYTVPAWVFGSPETAAFFGSPALDLQGSFVRNISNLAARNYTQWTGSLVIKTAWRF